MQVKSKIFSSLLQPIPLVFFLLYIKLIPPQAMYDWAVPYYSSVCLSLLVFYIFHKTKEVLSLIYVGIYSYMFVGALGQLFKISALNQWLGDVKAAGMLLCVLLVFISVLLNAVFKRRDKTVIAGLMIFTAITLLLFVWGQYFAGHFMLGEILPFFTLFGLYQLASRYIRPA